MTHRSLSGVVAASWLIGAGVTLGDDLSRESAVFEAVFRQQLEEHLDAGERARGMVLCVGIDPGGAPQSAPAGGHAPTVRRPGGQTACRVRPPAEGSCRVQESSSGNPGHGRADRVDRRRRSSRGSQLLPQRQAIRASEVPRGQGAFWLGLPWPDHSRRPGVAGYRRLAG